MVTHVALIAQRIELCKLMATGRYLNESKLQVQIVLIGGEVSNVGGGHPVVYIRNGWKATHDEIPLVAQCAVSASET